jgi:Ser/Thr protein kinase RdoA (MazF antagonist)
MTAEEQLTKKYGLREPKCKNLNTLANDSYEVVTLDGHFALKVYNATARKPQEIQWELELTLHLIENGAPVAHPVAGTDGNYLQTFSVDDEDRVTALFEWAAGEKPKPELSTYVLLGEAAARIHSAADSFTSDLPREEFDARELFDHQLSRMKKPLEGSGQWQRVYDLTERMRKIVSNPKLNYGVIHNDLTLDNIHLYNSKLIVFDFDSAAKSWRAAEPWGVLKASDDRFQAWLEGYRSVRDFSQEDEQAVAAFMIIEDIRNVVWKLGFARSSRGKPLMQTEDMPGVVDEWLEWESQKIKER